MDLGNLIGGFALDTMQGVWDITCLRWFNESMHHATVVGVDDGFYLGFTVLDMIISRKCCSGGQGGT